MELGETDMLCTCAPSPFERGIFGFATTQLDFSSTTGGVRNALNNHQRTSQMMRSSPTPFDGLYTILLVTWQLTSSILGETVPLLQPPDQKLPPASGT